MDEKRCIQEWIRRYTSFLFSLFILAIGVSLTIRANLGCSPITCPPYILSRVPHSFLTVGGFIFCMQVFFVVAQIFLLRKDYKKIQLLQLLVCLAFGYFTDVAMWLTSHFQWDSSFGGYAARAVQLIAACAITGVGISWEVRCNVLLIPGEGLPLTIAKVFHFDFGKVKIAFDTALVVVALIFCYIFFGQWRWDMIGFGTLFSMLFVGFVVRKVNPHMGWLDRLMEGSEVQPAYVNSRKNSL